MNRGEIGETIKKKDNIREFGYQGRASRHSGGNDEGIGAEFKDSIFTSGQYHIAMTCFEEPLLYHDSKMYLNFDKKDKYGMPVITFERVDKVLK